MMLVEDVMKYNCTDEVTMQIFEFVNKGVSDACWKNTVSLIVVGIMGGAELISTLILYFFAKRVDS